MDRSEWTVLQASLQLQTDPDRLVVPKPTSEILDAFEKQDGFPLPASYREFMMLFGPGELGEQFVIFGPCCENQAFDLGQFNQQWTEAWARTPTLFERSFEKPEQIRRLVFFSRTLDNDQFGWDPEDVRDARKHEYGVYSLPRLAEQATWVASTFREYVEDVCLGLGGSTKQRNSSAGQEQPPATFVPAVWKKAGENPEGEPGE